MYDRISFWENRINEIEQAIYDAKESGMDTTDLQMDLHEAEDELNFAWQDDERDYLYALEQQQFNPDGSLVGYPCN